MSSSRPILRSQTVVKPTNTYQAMHPKAREYCMERDARNAASDNVTTSQAKADQAKAVREEQTFETPGRMTKVRRASKL
jgi:hypothetical protein